MKKKTKIIIACLIVLVLIISGLLIYKFVFDKKEEEKPPVTNISNVTNKIESFDYTLDDRDSELFEQNFQELKKNLESEKIDEEEYAKSIAKLFIIDLYTIDNKVSKYDIGGLEYLYKDAKESFRAKVLDTLYKTVEDNSYKTRKQELPEVKAIEILSIKDGTYKLNSENVPSKEIDLSWTYLSDLGYDTKGKVILIKNETKWEIISYSSNK